MELRHLRYFLAVADAGSFTAAAQRLRRAQPAVSLQIRDLERELGVRLIERGARTRGLTEAGARRGRVRFGCALQSLTEGRLAGLLARFHRLHPGLRVAFREAHTDPLLGLLGQGRLDLALVHLAPGESAAGEPGGIELEPLYDEPLMLAVNRGHRLEGRDAVAWKDLAREELVSFGAGATVRRLVSRAARQAGVRLRSPIVASNLGTVRALVAAGLGVAILPRSVFRLPGAPVRGLRLVAPRLTRTVVLARNRDRHESPAGRTFTDFLREALRKN